MSKKTKIELINKQQGNIKFRDWTPGNGDGNHCVFEFDEFRKLWEFSFHRVDSFLGNKISGEITTNKMGDFEEERYFQFDNDSNTKNLKWVLVNEYEYFNSKLDEIVK